MTADREFLNTGATVSDAACRVKDEDPPGPGAMLSFAVSSGVEMAPTDSPPIEPQTTAQKRVTDLLLDWRRGDPAALEQLTPIVYDELRRLAHRSMGRESARDLLQTTALVHEAYLRLVGEEIPLQNRAHFFAIAATVMRRVLVDFARRRGAEKRGGGVELVALEEADQVVLPAADADSVEMLALDTALERLAAFDARKARILELRFFTGLTIRETAGVLEVSKATVEREFKVAKAWLYRALEERLAPT